MHIVYRAYCPDCDINWQAHEETSRICPRCGSRMSFRTETTVPEKLDLGPGWHRIVMLPEETETAADVVEREIQRWRDGDYSELPDEDQ